MDYDFGNAEFVWTAQERAPIGQTGKNDPRLNPDPVLLYLWDCLKQAGTPPSPHKAVTPRANILFYANPLALAWSGGKVDEVLNKSKADFLKETGLSARQVRAKLDADFKFTPQTVPYDKLIDPYKATETRRVYAQIEYIRWYGGFKPTSPTQEVWPFVSIGIPIAVRFVAQTICVCEGGDLAKRYLARDEIVERLDQSDKSKEMLIAHEKELCERLRKGNFKELLEDELPPLGGGKSNSEGD